MLKSPYKGKIYRIKSASCKQLCLPCAFKDRLALKKNYWIIFWRMLLYRTRETLIKSLKSVLSKSPKQMLLNLITEWTLVCQILNIQSKTVLKKKSVKKPTPTSPKTFLLQKEIQKISQLVLALYTNLKQAIKFIDVNFNRRAPCWKF